MTGQRQNGGPRIVPRCPLWSFLRHLHVSGVIWPLAAFAGRQLTSHAKEAGP
ncbi:MAG TPA: hypothetical protein VF060_06080 [Trebonia sp.]